jgi:hypothetical protein
MCSRGVANPVGAWPLEMRAKTAAGSCDEPSVNAFLAKVQKGTYPNPVRLRGSFPKWHRHKPDARARHVGEAPPTGRTFRWRSLFEFHLNTGPYLS